MPRPLNARIDISALEQNLGVVRRHLRHSAQTRILAVLKADAYGHGLLRAAEGLKRAEGFAVMELEAAIALRDAGYRQTILLLEGFFAATEIPLLVQHHLGVVVHHGDQLKMLAQASKGAGQGNKLPVFLKINTGMNRLGFSPADFPAALETLRACRVVGEITLMTHFASADEAAGIAEQLHTFTGLAGGRNLPCSLANSAALLRYPKTHSDWVRPGIMLYGASPFADQSAEQLGLRPAMTLSSNIIAVQHLKAGDRVGYGGAFCADRTMRVGIVAAGYADGYPRDVSRQPGDGAGGGAPILVDGARSRVLGRVSMDMLHVDLSHLPHAHTGSAVTLWGQGLPVEEVARAAGTVSYELLCALAARVNVQTT